MEKKLIKFVKIYGKKMTWHLDVLKKKSLYFEIKRN